MTGLRSQSSYAAELSWLQRAGGVEPRVGSGPGRRGRRQKSPDRRGGRHLPAPEMLPEQTTSARRILPSSGDEGSGEGPPRTERHAGAQGRGSMCGPQKLAAHGAEGMGRPERGIRGELSAVPKRAQPAPGTRQGRDPRRGILQRSKLAGGRGIWVVDPMNPIWLGYTPKCELEVRGQNRPGDGSHWSGRKAPSGWALGGGARESSLC